MSAFTTTVPIFVLTTGNYTYNRLMHYNDVFNINLAFRFPYLHNMHAMYISCNSEVYLCNHCCSIKSIIITFSENVFEASFIHQAKRILHTVVCDLSSCIILFNIVSSTALIFEERDRERYIWIFNIFTS
jgi:hypothetical protein